MHGNMVMKFVTDYQSLLHCDSSCVKGIRFVHWPDVYVYIHVHTCIRVRSPGNITCKLR